MYQIKPGHFSAGQEFSEFVAGQAACNIDSQLPISFEDIPPSLKGKIREHLHASQCGRCAYCERPIKVEASKIEHFHPQSLSNFEFYSSTCGARTNASGTSWRKVNVSLNNLLLCCEGTLSKGREFTCDTRKANSHICDVFYNPKSVSASVGSLVRIERSGEGVVIHFPSTQSQAQGVYDDILGLNDKALKGVRGDFYVELMVSFTNKFHRLAANAPKQSGARGSLKRKLLGALESNLAAQSFPSVRLSVVNEIKSR
ncbi:hypothetical protein ACFWQJ_10355 [Kocuria palustris]|uniref:hypothetical protein n=1 Tax=Kocuria palustris TaxID=71999 RepID=UPI00364D919F